MKAKISEIFLSIQGEGSFVGRIATFVRFCGCNLRCYFCDTKYALECSDEVSEEKVFEKIKKYNARTVVFTGGEPTLYDDFMHYFITKHREYEYFLETNGTIYPYKSVGFFRHVVVSPKIFALNFDVLEVFAKEPNRFEFKFVVGEDFDKEVDVIKKLSLKMVTFQPIWYNDDLESYLDKTRKIIERVKTLDMNVAVRVVPQMHKILYGDVRGK